MIGFDERMTIRFEETANISMNGLASRISEGKINQSWTHFLVADVIDYKEINLNDGRIEIVRTPTVFNPFKANGRIVLTLNEISDNNAQLKCEILPFDGTYPIIVGLFIAFFTLMSLLILLFGRGNETFLLILFMWTIFGLIQYVAYSLNKHGLIDYSKKVIKELTKTGKAK